MSKIVLIGFGGHAHSVIDSVIQKNEYEIVGYVDVNKHEDYLGIKYLGNDDNLQDIFNSGVENAVVCIGYMGNSNLRNEVYNKLKTIGYSLPSIIDETAVLASNVSIGEGTFVGKGAIINADSNIGKMCIINSKALIEHDCIIGDFSHIAVDSCLCGEVKIGNSVFLGANSTIVQGVSIGNDAFVGAGVIVTNNINSNEHISIKCN